MRKKNVIPIEEMKKEHMKILNKKKVILENDVSDMTTRKNTDPNSGIYPTAVKLAQCIILAETRKTRKGQKRKQQRRQPPSRIVFNNIDMKIFRNASTKWII